MKLGLILRYFPLDTDLPTISVKQGNRDKDRIVLIHADLHSSLIGTSHATSDRWIQVARAMTEGVGNHSGGTTPVRHTLCHRYARHLPLHAIPINYCVLWPVSGTLIYPELVPRPTVNLSSGCYNANLLLTRHLEAMSSPELKGGVL